VAVMERGGIVSGVADVAMCVSYRLDDHAEQLLLYRHLLRRRDGHHPHHERESPGVAGPVSQE
jgi:hypothetical protein